MSNIYINNAVQEDVENDQNVLTSLRTPILNAIHLAQDLEKKGAMAYNDDVLIDIVEKLDSILSDNIDPIQQQLDSASCYFIERNK